MLEKPTSQRNLPLLHTTIPPDQLSMDHIVPLARGGKSIKGNIVPSCMEYNRKKKLETPAEAILRELSE
ncbi:MAG: HNH endonuclease [Nitrospirae bacterium]|nr:HNH endonuclease [Nitrospirota bacterium]MDA1304930.1 HNH endonuclease [Nitrospirota bacterium]